MFDVDVLSLHFHINFLKSSWKISDLYQFYVFSQKYYLMKKGIKQSESWFSSGSRDLEYWYGTKQK